ncbi:MAG: thioredoxin family protein, partial [Puniceicoccales bacterium]
DDSGKVGKEYDATNTPQMFVIDPAGEIIYMGAIDSTKSATAGDIENSTNYVDFSISPALADFVLSIAPM